MAACVCFQRPYAEVNSPKLFTWIDVNALLVLLLERLMLDLHANAFRVAFKDLLFSCLRSSKVTEDFHLSFSACLLLTRPLAFCFFSLFVSRHLRAESPSQVVIKMSGSAKYHLPAAEPL